MHQHVIGASGQGKTKFLEHCIQQDILAGHGVCLIDPEGVLYEDILRFCIEIHSDKDPDRSIHLLDPTEPDWLFKFNPLHVHEGEKPRHRIDNVIEALAQVWGGEDSRDTPSIRTTVRAIFSALVERGYSLAEAFTLTSTNDTFQIINYLTRDLDNPILEDIWSGYRHAAEKSSREHMIEFSGSRRRLGELLTDNDIRAMLANHENPLDFKQVMDSGDIVLVNLSAEAMGDDVARAVGALLVRELFYCASRRSVEVAEEAPFFAYIDECAEFMTNDISRILARSRKRGLHVTLAHQWLNQLREQGDDIYHGVMGIQNKAVFGGLSDEDAVILADQLFRTEYDLEVPVAALIKPVVVGYERTWLNNWSESISRSEGHADSSAEGTSSGETTAATLTESDGTSYSVSQTYDQDGFPTGIYNVSTGTSSMTVDAQGMTQASGQSSMKSVTISETSSTAESHGASEALVPILKDMATAVHSLENIRHMAVARLRSIPPRNAVVKSLNGPTFDISTFEVKQSVVSDVELARTKQAILAASEYTIPARLAHDRLEIVRFEIEDQAENFLPAKRRHAHDDDDGTA